MIGTVGVPMTTIEARLESVPKMGYDALSSVPRGEICLRGTTLFSGYHKRQDLTEGVVVDGWFHTGTLLKCNQKLTFLLLRTLSSIIEWKGSGLIKELTSNTS